MRYGSGNNISYLIFHTSKATSSLISASWRYQSKIKFISSVQIIGMKRLINALFIYLICVGLPFGLFAQQLPESFWISYDGKRLITGNKPAEGFYNENNIKVVELRFAQTDWWTQLMSNRISKRDIPATLIYDGKTYPNVGVRFRGNTSFNFSATKKSYSITMDFTDSTQDLKGYETLHFNNAAEDPSFIREVMYLHLNRKHIPAAKANFIHLKINGENFGQYPNIQVLNGDFMKEWFLNNDGTRWRAERTTTGGGGFGAGTSTLNFLGTDTALYKPHYTLKQTYKQHSWQDLVKAVQALNTPNEDELKKVFDTDRALWFIAHEIMFGDDDSYVNKGGMDYYVFWDSATARITPIEYDGNSVFNNIATNWSPFLKETNAQFPLMNKLFAVPALRQRYLAHVRTMLEESLHPDYYNPLVDKYYALIDTFVASDPKKTTTYAQFTTAKTTIKNWLNARRNTYLNNAEVNRPYPAIDNVIYTADGTPFTKPSAGQSETIKAKISFAAGIQAVNLYYSTGLDGYFEKTTMKDDGLSGDGAAGDGVFGGKIPGYGKGTYVRFYIEAVANDAAKTVAYMPKGAEHDVYFYQVKLNQSNISGVVINEIMAANKTAVKDPNGQNDDWIEFHNLNATPLDMSNFYLTDDVSKRGKWQFPAGTSIPANGYLIVWADEDGNQTGLHANFKLSNSGETVILSDRDTAVIDQVIFGAQIDDRSFARSPNGTGDFVIKAHTFNKSNDSATPTTEILANDVKLYPNPTQTSVTIEVGLDKRLDAQVVNLLGQTIVRTQFSRQITLNTEGWQRGIYWVKIGDVVKKLVVQ
jgi:hypothetical protein